MTPYIFPADFARTAAKKEARKAKRAIKQADLRSLAAISTAKAPPSNDCPTNGPGYQNRATVKIERFKAKSKKRAKKKKSPTLSKLKKLLWAELRQVVYAQSPVCLTCGSDAPPVACHIIPSGDGAIIRFFLPAIYRGCRNCNDDERRHRGRWRGKFEELFGKDYVDALYAMSEEEARKSPADKFQIKKWWVLEQTERMRKLRGVA